ncbi:MAG: hypothetical protein QM714_06235 [Nocardioides sp.]
MIYGIPPTVTLPTNRDSLDVTGLTGAIWMEDLHGLHIASAGLHAA